LFLLLDIGQWATPASENIFVKQNFYMTHKTKNYLKWVPSVMVTVFIAFSSIMKLIHAPELAEQYARIGMQDKMAFFAVAELLFVGLFLFKRTLKLALLLFTGYYSGAMGVELSLGGYFILPAIILIVVWIACYLRDVTLFKPVIHRGKRLA